MKHRLVQWVRSFLRVNSTDELLEAFTLVAEELKRLEARHDYLQTTQKKLKKDLIPRIENTEQAIAKGLPDDFLRDLTAALESKLKEIAQEEREKTLWYNKAQRDDFLSQVERYING